MNISLTKGNNNIFYVIYRLLSNKANMFWKPKVHCFWVISCLWRLRSTSTSLLCQKRKKNTKITPLLWLLHYFQKRFAIPLSCFVMPEDCSKLANTLVIILKKGLQPQTFSLAMPEVCHKLASPFITALKCNITSPGLSKDNKEKRKNMTNSDGRSWNADLVYSPRILFCFISNDQCTFTIDR